MFGRKKKISVGVVIVFVVVIFSTAMWMHNNDDESGMIEVQPLLGAVQSVISTTATVLPKNRLEILSPVNGRIEKILVQEGEKISKGKIVAWISSRERAALIDAARGYGEEAFLYWEDAYKAIPLISPIDGEVIVAKMQPGQAVTTIDAVVVVSDRLIVKARVDETDISKIKVGLDSLVALSAYPNKKIPAKVDHIYYESKTVNNVTIYEVDVIPETVSDFFRSGMNATVDFIEKSNGDVLLLPFEVVVLNNDGAYVLVKRGNGAVKTYVTLGASDDINIEILSGITIDDIILVVANNYNVPSSSTGGNPFMPKNPRRH